MVVVVLCPKSDNTTVFFLIKKLDEIISLDSPIGNKINKLLIPSFIESFQIK